MAKDNQEQATFLFGKKNYMLVILGLVVIAIGYILMAGGGSDDPNVFNEEIFSPRRIAVAPIVILIGFVIEVYAIMATPNKNSEEE